MEQKLTRFLTLAACLLMGTAIGFVLTYSVMADRIAATPTMADEISAGSAKYAEIMSLVNNYFIGEDVDETAINDSMAAGVIAGLGDRWSYYISAADYQSYVDNISNSYVGVGITITGYYDDRGDMVGYEVTEVTPGGPAEEAGVLAGDILISASGVNVADITLEETKNLVKGAEGTTVNLVFLRGDATVPLTIERRSFTLTPAVGTMLSGNVGYIIIDNFDSGCSNAVIGLVEELQAQGATSLLFDVRNNPGGLKTELTALLDYLLPEGTIFHTIDYSGYEELITSDAACVDLPMAVLVNADSYSAAEYFACALQEYDAGKVVGVQTCGKGYYQVGLNLSDGSCVNLSVGKYYTPSGESLIDKGVTPDQVVELDDDLTLLLLQNKLEPENDPQVQAALSYLLP